MQNPRQSYAGYGAFVRIFPWPALCLAVPFVLWMWLASDPMLGFVLAWLAIFCAAPLMLLLGIAGAGSAAPVAAFIILGVLFLLPGLLMVLAAWRTRSVAAWSAGLNLLVLVLGVEGGVYASIVRFSDAWPY